MITEISQRLSQKSKQAGDLILFLRSEIDQIRKMIVDKRIQEVTQQLEKENAELRNEVEELKGVLSEVEARSQQGHSSKISHKALGDAPKPQQCSMINQPVVTCTKPPATRAPEKSPSPEKKPAEATTKQEPATPKSAETKPAKPQKEKKSGNQAPKEDEKPVDVSRLDFRIGRILNAKKHPDADSLYVEEVELGENKPRTVVSGLVKFVPLEEMQNRLVVLLCNLKPVKMRGITSEAMVMCASTPEKVEILNPPADSVPGERIAFEDYSGTPDAQLNPKKKIFEQVAPDLKTNDQGIATYKGVPFVVPGKGVVSAPSLCNVQIK